MGNCASSLIQGIYYYAQNPHAASTGLMHQTVGGFRPQDIEIVTAFDIDARKVGKDVAEAIFAPPNCTTIFCSTIPQTGTLVQMGKILDGVAEHMENYSEDRTFKISSATESTQEQIVANLKKSGAEMLVNYLPVGSEQATRFYAECALEAGIGFINCMPVFIASDPAWAKRFAERNLPIIGDDIKAQIGATITHRTLADLFKKRGAKLTETYQINTGGNTDFLNMLNRSRLASKKISKTAAVQAVLADPLPAEKIHIGPSDYVPWQNDNKVAFIRMQAELFGGVPMNLEMRLSVEDSPNSAGVAIDMIRCCKLALDRKQGGVILPPSAYFCKHPPQQFTDDEAYAQTESFINEM
ncbi:MAG: inositol-3-phosphate synthase [Gammaproteobacteria bacterium]